MKKVRNIFIILIIVLLVGCSKEYTLTVDNDKIVEEIDAVVEDNEDNNQILNLNYYPLHAVEDILYEKKIKKSDNLLNAHFKYTYSPSDFVNANTINECFETKQIIVDNEDYYYFKLENIKSCMSDYNVNINIVTKNKVLTNNADEFNNNKYIWHLTNENKDNFKLEIKIDKKKYSSNNYLNIIVVLGIIFLLIITSLIFLTIKRNKSNKI